MLLLQNPAAASHHDSLVDGRSLDLDHVQQLVPPLPWGLYILRHCCQVQLFFGRWPGVHVFAEALVRRPLHRHVLGLCTNASKEPESVEDALLPGKVPAGFPGFDVPLLPALCVSSKKG